MKKKKKKGHFPNFKRQLQNITIPKEVEERSTLENAEELFKTKLMLFLGVLGFDSWEPIRKELQKKFYQWMAAAGIDADEILSDKNLKHFFLETMEIIEKSSEKIYQEQKARLHRIKKEKPFKPEEVAKVFSKVGNIMANPPQLPSPDIIKGNAGAGKEIFEKIANSVSDSERHNFHFYPPLTEEERTEAERKESEENQSDPILEGLKISVKAQIQSALNQEPPLTNSELSLQYQNWEEQIEEGKKIAEVEKIKISLLTEIYSVREKKQQSEIIPSTNSYKPWIILGVIGLVLIGLVIWLEIRKKKRRNKN